MEQPNVEQDTLTSAPVKRARPAPSKTFQCRGHGDCRMVFSRSEHLARHIRKHTGERPFTCHCGKQFSRLDNLRQHAQTVHADKPEMNERMMRELGRVHATMVAANKQAASGGGGAGSSGRGTRGSQDSPGGAGPTVDRGGRPAGRSKARPGTSTGYEGAGGGEDMYGLSMPPNQLSLSTFPVPDSYLIPKKEKSNDDLASLALDGENGNGPYSRTENTSNGWYNRFHPHSHHSYTYNTYNSSLNSDSTSYPIRSSSTHSPSLSSSSSPSPVHDLESSFTAPSSAGPANFPYEHLPHLPFNTASASAPYLPLTASPVTEIPPMPLSSTAIQQQHQRRSSSRTSHSHPSLHIHASHGQMHSPPLHARSPYHSPPLSASHSGGSSSASAGGYFPLSPAESSSNDLRHQQQQQQQQQQHHHHGSTSLPGTPFEGGGPPYSTPHGYPLQRVPSRGPVNGPNGGYTTSAAWVSQGSGVPGGGGVGVGYWA